MAGFSDVGDICETHRRTSIKWNVPNYFRHSHMSDMFIESPTFCFSSASWCLRIYRSGERCIGSAECMGVYLVLLNSEKTIRVSFSLGISYDGDNVYFQANKSDVFGDDPWQSRSGFPRFIARETLLRDRYKITINGTLTIFCVANSALGVSEKATQTYDSSSLSLDFQDLLQSEHKCDVTIKVKSQTFRAHKLILGARSSVFAAMFAHDMKENSSGMVNIEDCDPDVFQDFLLFMYTGKIETLSLKNFSQLYMLSDKYDLSDLKEMCVNFMKDNLNLDICCEVIVIADKHNEQDLRASSTKFITSHMRSLLLTQQFSTLMTEHPALACELLITALPVNS